jgi:adenylate kinase
MIIVFLGVSGSGKDTQAQLIASNSSFQPISTGNLIRDISNGATRIQTYIKKSLQDKFSSDELVYGLLQLYIKYSRGEDFILTGAVRRASQIEKLDKILADIGQKVDKVFLFKLDDELAVLRLSNRLICKVCGRNYNLITQPPKSEDTCDACGSALSKRDDDNPDAIKNRIAEFHKYNQDILKEYIERNLLVEIDASLGIDQIYLQVQEHLDDLFTSNT